MGNSLQSLAGIDGETASLSSQNNANGGKLRTITSDEYDLDATLVPLGVKNAGSLYVSSAPGLSNRYVKIDGERVRFQRSLVQDLDFAARQLNVGKVVTLITESELKQYRMGSIEELCEARAIDWLWLPVDDMASPKDGVQFYRLVALVCAHLRESKDNSVLVHCAAGLGRAGTFAACCMIEMHAPNGNCSQASAAGSAVSSASGTSTHAMRHDSNASGIADEAFSVDRAIAHVRRYRPGAIQSNGQARFIKYEFPALQRSQMARRRLAEASQANSEDNNFRRRHLSTRSKIASSSSSTQAID
jgi:protein-tyrosine phosphatase